MTNAELISNFEKLVAEERRVTRQVLERIAEIESRRAYLDLGFDGMYAYLTRGLGYSEGAAYRRLQAARLLSILPTVAEKFESGKLNLTQLADVAKASRQTRKIPSLQLIQKLESKTKGATEQIIAHEFDFTPRIDTRQCTQRDHSVRLELTFTAHQFAEIEKARALLSHICPDGLWSEVFTELARRYSKTFEPRALATSTKDKKLSTPSSGTPISDKPDSKTKNSAASSSGQPHNSLKTPPAERRRSIPLTRKRIVFSQAQEQCEHRHPLTGLRCQSKYQLQIDHRIPLSRGGPNDLANLQLLCASHNRAKGTSLENSNRGENRL